MRAEQDDLDGCAEDFTADPTPDDEVDALVLFADIDPGDEQAVADRQSEWVELLGEGP